MGRAAINLLNETFDQLTVIERVYVPGSRAAHWRCECTCGNFVVVRSRALRTGHTTSCGCKRKVTAPQNQACRIVKLVALRTDLEAAIHRSYAEYRGTALEFGRAFTLALADFSELVQADCHYCGSPPSSGSTPRSKRRSKVLLNGIDRVNSALGYVRGNVVPSCKHCNRAKLDRTPEEFIEHCKRVVQHYESRQDVAQRA